MAWRPGSLLPPCRSVAPSTWPAWTTPLGGCTLSRCLSSRPPSRLRRRHAPGGHPSPASARVCVWCCATRCMRAPVAPGSRMLWPLAASSKVPRHPRAHARGPPGRRSGLPTSRGPARKRRCSASGPIRRAKTISPPWSTTMARATRAPSERLHEPGGSMPYAHATQGARGKRASTGQERSG